MFDQFTKKSRKGANIPATFLIGSALGAIGAYFFLTEKGVSSRKMIVEKAGQLSSSIADRLAALRENASEGHDEETRTEQPETVAATENGSSPSVKARNMVSHLKHEPTEPTDTSLN